MPYRQLLALIPRIAHSNQFSYNNLRSSCMSSALIGRTALILVANGVDEAQLTEMQRALTKAGVVFTTVAPEQGLVNSWHGGSWGHYFPVDKVIGEALGSDFDMLILPGGERSATKLKQNLHTRRIVNHFLDAGKPIAAIGAGVGMIALGTRCANRAVAAPDNLSEELTAAQIRVASEPTMIDQALMTCRDDAPQPWIDMMLGELNGAEPMQQRAA
jgi:protease I